MSGRAIKPGPAAASESGIERSSSSPYLLMMSVHFHE
jgi:hypothetical protein